MAEPVKLKVRRVVTGHNAAGRAIVTHDALTENAISRRPGQQGVVLWTSDRVPVNNMGTEDEAFRDVGTSLARGTVFRIVEYQPGVAGRNHRTDSVDYAVVLTGEIDMELDDGVQVTLRAGDTLIQRSTIHNWVNRGKEACRIAFVLIGAEPIKIGSEVLAERG